MICLKMDKNGFFSCVIKDKRLKELTKFYKNDIFVNGKKIDKKDSESLTLSEIKIRFLQKYASEHDKLLIDYGIIK